MASREELEALRTKIETLGNLTDGERRFLLSVIDRTSKDVLGDADLDQVSGGMSFSGTSGTVGGLAARPRGWVEAGCFG
jgi:hypothetical protein